MDLVDEPHQLQVTGADRNGFIVQARPGEPEHPALPGQRKLKGFALDKGQSRNFELW